jgi:hypothetical protein
VTGGRKLARHDFCRRLSGSTARLTAAPFRGDHDTQAKWLWVEPSFRFSLLLRMIFSENRQPPSDRCPRASFFGIML